MEKDRFPSSVLEQTAVSTFAVLQEGLGVTEDVAQDLASIQVACPVPGVTGQMSLGEFMASPHGADKASQIIEVARDALNEGVTPDKALHRALGFAAIMDKDTGRLARVSDSATELKKN